MKSLNKSILLALLAILSVTGSYASKGLETMFLEHKVVTNSQGLKIGDNAPAFVVVSNDLKEVTVGGTKDKIQVIAFVPSIDTDTCALETVYFNKRVAKMNNVEINIISKDTPFAFSRFCKANDIKNINTLSDYKGASNARKYGSVIVSPKFLEGFFARTVYIVNTKGKIAYKQVIGHIEKEPNYKDILAALKGIK
ncbi:Thiol peroxidase, Tpx-type (EC 1.11.1.15) [uncultured Gammaproteobacteria bacterium]|jgi:thiol peroxidase|nr:Thiol peroxidase, Tpx-type (EC 1.11.1.15) [uncultured Gammaproteobacteria bacterium]